MEKNINRAVALDKDTDRMLSQLAKRYEDNKSLCMRELIRAAALSMSNQGRKVEAAGTLQGR
jgi:predicted transcriptional regulator